MTTLIALFIKESGSTISVTKPTKIATTPPKQPVLVVTSRPVVSIKPALPRSNVITQPVIKPKVVIPKRVELTIVPKRVVTKPVVHRPKPEPKVVLTRSIILAVLTAAKAEKLESLQFILNRKPGLRSAVDHNGATIMHWLAEADWPEGIELFSRAGGNVNARKKDGVTPLQVAAALGKIKALDTLIGLGAKPSLEDSRGRTALSIAKERGQEEASELLLK